MVVPRARRRNVSFRRTGSGDEQFDSGQRRRSDCQIDSFIRQEPRGDREVVTHAAPDAEAFDVNGARQNVTIAAVIRAQSAARRYVNWRPTSSDGSRPPVPASDRQDAIKRSIMGRHKAF